MKLIQKLLIFSLIFNNFTYSIETLDQALKKYNYTHKIPKRSILGNLASALKLVANDPNKNRSATLRISEDLSKEEQDFLLKRKVKVKACLEKFLDQQIGSNKVPNIAFCGSGGGLRAMFSTIGVLTGLEKLDLLDAITYFAALSGSTFALSSWMVHKNKAIDTQRFLINQFSRLFVSNFEINEVIKTAIGRALYGQKLSPVNLYGALLANRLFADLGNQAYHIKLSETSKAITNGDFPFPIYTAISTSKVNNKFNWFEFNPYEVSFKYNNDQISIPSWALGRKFKNGHTSSKAPENSLGFVIGICGSAFTISAEELVKMYHKSIPFFLRQSLEFITTKTDFGDLRILPGAIYNPLFRYTKRTRNNIPYQNLDTLYLIDAGIDFNVPTPPLLKPERNVDIILIMDSSSDIINAPELKKAENYAKFYNLRFPKIDYSQISSKNISVFSNKDPKVPTIIYIPLIKNPNYSVFDPTDHETNKYLNTFNLHYTEEESADLCGLTTFNILSNKQILKDTILATINNK